MTTMTKRRMIALLITSGNLTGIHQLAREELANLLREHCKPDDEHVLDYYRLREVGEIVGEDDEVNSKDNDYLSTLQAEDYPNGWLCVKDVGPIFIGQTVKEDYHIVFRTCEAKITPRL